MPVVKTAKTWALTGAALLLVFGFLGWLGDEIGMRLVFGGMMIACALWAYWDFDQSYRRSEKKQRELTAARLNETPDEYR